MRKCKNDRTSSSIVQTNSSRSLYGKLVLVFLFHEVVCIYLESLQTSCTLLPHHLTSRCVLKIITIFFPICTKFGRRGRVRGSWKRGCTNTPACRLLNQRSRRGPILHTLSATALPCRCMHIVLGATLRVQLDSSCATCRLLLSLLPLTLSSVVIGASWHSFHLLMTRVRCFATFTS